MAWSVTLPFVYSKRGVFEPLLHSFTDVGFAPVAVEVPPSAAEAFSRLTVLKGVLNVEQYRGTAPRLALVALGEANTSDAATMLVVIVQTPDWPTANVARYVNRAIIALEKSFMPLIKQRGRREPKEKDRPQFNGLMSKLVPFLAPKLREMTN